jgi:predicted flap endonuclease-1-like 5' DNA nuclease
MFEQNIAQGPGTGTFSQHTWEILIMLLGAFLLGLWLGWILWSRYKQLYEKQALDLNSLALTTETLRAELTALQSRTVHSETDNQHLDVEITSLNRDNSLLRDRINELEASLSELRAHTRKVETELGLNQPADTPIDPDDIPLEINDPNVEGFLDEDSGIPETLASDFIETELAGMGPVEDQEIIEAFTIAPTPDTTPAPPPEPPIIEPVIVGALSTDKDDLTVVEGIGPKIQELLYQYGIRTYTQLADTDVTRLKEILSSAGPQLAMHDPGTWPSQANLAANGQWESLKAIQGFLKGGKKPDKPSFG